MYCKVLKLLTGETIICSVAQETKTYIDVEKPIKVLVAPIGKDSFNVMLIKWDPTVDFELPIRVFKQSIVSVGEPNEDFRESYMEIYNKYNGKESESKERDEIDDLSDELEALVDMLAKHSSNSNATYH